MASTRDGEREAVLSAQVSESSGKVLELEKDLHDGEDRYVADRRGSVDGSRNRALRRAAIGRVLT